MKTLTRDHVHPLGPVNLLMVSVMKTKSDTQAPLTATTTMNRDYIVELISVISQKTDLHDSPEGAARKVFTSCSLAAR